MPMKRIFHGGYCPVADPQIRAGRFRKDFGDVVACRYSVPSFWGIGRVHQRLVLAVTADEGTDAVSAL